MRFLLITTILAAVCGVVAHVRRAFVRELDAEENAILGPVRPHQPHQPHQHGTVCESVAKPRGL